MAEDNKPSLVGSVAGSIASGVYEGVKGAVIGGAVGAATAGILTDSMLPENLPTVVSENLDKVANNATKYTEALLDNIKNILPPVPTAAAVGATVGAASGVINGTLNTTSRADRELAQQNIEDAAKINQLAAGVNMLGGALANTQQALMETQQQVGVLGKFTEKVLKDRANPNAAVELASKPQVGSFTAKEAARGHDSAHLGA